jgi:hypothetical protein
MTKASTEYAPLAACVEFMTERFPVTDFLGSELPCGKAAEPCGHGRDQLDRST